MDLDRAALAEFLRHRRESLQPEDVGLPRGQRRRTSGLRREEVAALCHISADYYSRLERARGPRPSEQMIVSLAQGLRLSLAERDHLLHLAGHHAPEGAAPTEHLSAGMLRIMDRLHDTPAEIVTELGETLRQTPAAVALTGDLTAYEGFSRSIGYRWFTDSATRARYAESDHAHLSRLWASGLRGVVGRRGPHSRAAQMAQQLRDISEEFDTLWSAHELGVQPAPVKNFIHPEVGALALQCQTLQDPATSHSLLVYTATPGSESHEKLRLLSVIGAQQLA